MRRNLYNIDEQETNYKEYYQLPNGMIVCHVKLPPIRRLDDDMTVEDAMREQRRAWINTEAIQIAMTYGQYGWALYDNDIAQKFLDPLVYAIQSKSINQNVDSAIGSPFTKIDLSMIQNEMERLLKDDEDSIKKLREAIWLFKKKKYLSASQALVVLIDSQSIDILNKENYERTKQGLKSMAMAISLKFGDMFGLTLDYNASPQSRVEELFEKLPQYKITDNSDENFLAYEIINLAHSFKTIFADHQWETSDELPAAINRHYLAHGQYKCDDVKRFDCIKLLFLLRKMLRVYSHENTQKKQ